MMRRLLMAFLYYGLVWPVVTGQNMPTSVFTEKLDGKPFSHLVQRIESQSQYRLYYDTTALNKLNLQIDVQQASLSVLLTRALETTQYRFAVDGFKVYITPDFAIQTQLPADFLTPVNDSSHRPRLTDISKIGRESNLSTDTLIIIGEARPKPDATATINGYIRDHNSSEAIPGAVIMSESPSITVFADQFGYYSLQLPVGLHQLRFTAAGKKVARRNLQVYSSGQLEVAMQDTVESLKNVTITAAQKSNIKSVQMGTEKLAIKAIKRVPAVLGEVDVLKVLLALPGVTSVGEASTGFNVRGGATDQNLILFNDATIYNPSHLFGFFSVFNPDAVKGIELFKSAIPEKYGGRLSSVLNVAMREGNAKKITTTGGIGLLTGRLTVEGPLKADKTTFIVGGRTTYSDWLLKQLPSKVYQNSNAGFYDANLGISHVVNARSSLFLTGYLSSDKFTLNLDTAYQYNNRNANLKWKYIFNRKFYGVAIAAFDQYGYSIGSEKNEVNAYKLKFRIQQSSLRTDFHYNPNNKVGYNFGAGVIYYQLQPGSFTPATPTSLVASKKIANEQGLEASLYAGIRYNASSRLLLQGGMRLSLFNYTGPHTIYHYLPGAPREPSTITDSTVYGRGQSIKRYARPEIRFSSRYTLGLSDALKVSVNTTVQFIHMISNTTSISPTDVWKLSDPFIEPQQAYQVSAGYFKNMRNNTLELSAELYYKGMEHYLDYKNGAVLLMNDHIESDIINTRGKAYGLELMARKTTGKLTGWLSYAFARTLLQADDSLAGQTINDGDFYPANFDRPHSANLVANFQLSHRLSFSLNMIYNTGRPITLPVAVYNFGGSQRVFYSNRNEFRIPDYMRADVSVNIEGNHKIKKLAHSSWSLGVYNLLARQNPYSVYFTQEAGRVQGYQLSIFATAIPFITYNFKF